VSPNETERIRERYERRRSEGETARWQELDPVVWAMAQDKERGIIRALRDSGLWPLDERRVVDIGCGGGGDLLTLIRLGFDPANLTGCELLPERAGMARHRLPSAVTVHQGDALEAPLPEASFDVVLQATVFTSLLDEEFRERLAERMWQLVRPGGGVLWFDFVYDNPRNPDVKAVTVTRLRELFPEGRLNVRRVMLAPPIARMVTPIHPALYGIVNALPPLRTHVMAWIAKDGPGAE
jgi:SAM-dependent methyltransferase